MSSKSEILKSLERKIVGSRRSNTFAKAMRMSSEHEANYLMSGYATEIIDTIALPRAYDRNAEARIYGVVAADTSKHRYVWFYLFHGYHLWRCYNLKDAYETIEKIKKHCALEEKAYNLKYYTPVKANKKELCNN